MKFSLVMHVVVLAMVCHTAQAIKQKLIDEINICKRNDPELSKCFCTNFKNLVPKLKDGAPEMNMIPLDPVVLDNIYLDFQQTQSVKLIIKVQNMSIFELTKVHTEKCHAFMTSDGLQAYLDLHFPKLSLKSQYNAKGNFLIIEINASGNFNVEATELRLECIWNATRYIKNNKEHLHVKGNIYNIRMNKVSLYFGTLFGNNTVLNNSINKMINENIDMVVEETTPIVLDTIQKITEQLVNNFYDTFSYDELYPKE